MSIFHNYQHKLSIYLCQVISMALQIQCFNKCSVVNSEYSNIFFFITKSYLSNLSLKMADNFRLLLVKYNRNAQLLQLEIVGFSQLFFLIPHFLKNYRLFREKVWLFLIVARWMESNFYQLQRLLLILERKLQAGMVVLDV